MEYNIKDIITYLKGESEKYIDHPVISKIFFSTLLKLVNLDNEINKLALAKANVQEATDVEEITDASETANAA